MSSPASAPQAGDVLQRIRAGDREAAAEFLMRNEALLRRRYRNKVGSSLRRIMDSEDLVATLSRRLDAYVASGRVQALTIDQFWTLIHRMVEHLVSDKARVLKRLKRAEADDRALAEALARRLETGPGTAGDEPLSVLPLIEDATDREIVRLWLGEIRLDLIGERLGLSAANVRKRWQRIRTALRSRLEGA
jgi:DNA-directed RNA polymerase specialized sigma24 family protein